VPNDPESKLGFDDRVAVVALALLEGSSPQRVDGLRGASLDGRALERLEVLPQSRAVRGVLADVGAWPRPIVRFAVAVIVVVVGVGSAALVSSTGAVSVPAVLVGTLGLQTLLLLAWLLALVPFVGAAMRRLFVRVLTGPVRTIGIAGSAVMESIRTPEAVSEWLARWKRGTEQDHALLGAVVGAISLAYAPRRGPLAALVYGVWSNAAWIAANVLMLVVLAVQLLRSRNYTLHSGLISPELSHEWVEGIVRLLAVVLPSSMLPDGEAMTRAALEPAGIAADSWRWGTMLLASLVAFGLLPRVIALGLAMGLLPAARRRWRIPWDDARLAATRGIIEASAPPVVVLARERADGDAAKIGAHARFAKAGVRASLGSPAHESAEARGVLRPALLRVSESGALLGSARDDGPSAGGACAGAQREQPEAAANDPWIDLGCVTSVGLDAVDALAKRIEAERLSPLIIACSLTTAPRRGIADLLRAPVAAARGSAIAVLTDAARLRRGSRLSDLDTLLKTWTKLLLGVGVERVLEVDRSLPSPRGEAMIAALATGHEVRPEPPRRLADALQCVVDAAASWGDRNPSAEDERRLLDRIGAAYGVEQLTRRASFVVVLDDEATAARTLANRGLDAGARATGLATIASEARAAHRRATSLVGAVQLAVELEYQGCGEASISRAVAAAQRAWDPDRFDASGGASGARPSNEEAMMAEANSAGGVESRIERVLDAVREVFA